MNSQLITFTEDNKLLGDSQHAYRLGRSTVTNLLATDKLIAEWVNNSTPFDILLFDMPKAFDRVPHYLITNLVHRLGFSDSIVTWIQSFLTDRDQFVSLQSARSPVTPVTSGIIQGSVLGPVLWVLFNNDAAARLHVPVVIYAGDLKLLINLQHYDNIAAQAEIDIFCNWCKDNFVLINPEKSCCLHSSDNNGTSYYCNKTPKPAVAYFKDLRFVRSSDGGYALQFPKQQQSVLLS